MSVSDYADYLLAQQLATSQFDADFGSDWVTAEELALLMHDQSRKAFARHGYAVNTQFDEQAEAYVPWLVNQGALSKEGDAYTGTYYKLGVGQKSEALRKYLAGHTVGRRIAVLRADALGRALAKLAAENAWPSEAQNAELRNTLNRVHVAVPASDRIVYLDHNQAREVAAAADDVIQALARENGVDGDASLRERFLGQLRASKELILAQSVRAYLIYETLFNLLASLIERYRDQAIAEAAKKLLDLIVDRVLKS